jgi:DNA-binding IclR family transcriptional regulator
MRSTLTGEANVVAAQIRKTPTAPALEKGLDIIELLAARGRPLTLREVAEQLGRSKNEIFRMIHVLIERGYLVREGADGLVLTNKLFDIGLRTPRTRDLVTVATPLIQQLAREVRQSVHLVVANRGETVVIASTSGSEDMNFSLKLGYRRPLADAHSGLVLIAFQPEDRRDRLLAESARLMRMRPDRDAMDAELRAIRRDGYLVRPSRDLVGVTDIVAPIVLRDGEAIATLVVSYLDRRQTAAGEHAAALQPLLRICSALAERLETGSAPVGH